MQALQALQPYTVGSAGSELAPNCHRPSRQQQNNQAVNNRAATAPPPRRNRAEQRMQAKPLLNEHHWEAKVQRTLAFLDLNLNYPSERTQTASILGSFSVSGGQMGLIRLFRQSGSKSMCFINQSGRNLLFRCRVANLTCKKPCKTQ